MDIHLRHQLGHQALARLSATILGLALASLPPGVRAEALKDYSKLLGDIRASVVAAVVIVVPQKLFVANIREKDLAQQGCTYKVESRADLDSLMGMIADAKIVEHEPFSRFGPDLRLGIYLHTSDRLQEKLLFEHMATAPTPVYGVYGYENVSIRAMNPHFALGLRAWAAKRKPEPGPNCKENPETS